MSFFGKSMMTTISVEIPDDKIKEIKELVIEFGKQGLKPLCWAINKTMTGSATAQGNGGLIKASSDLLSDYINAQKSLLKEGPHTPGTTIKSSKKIWHIEKATPENCTGAFSCTSANIPLIYFSNQRGARAVHPKSISVQVFKERQREQLKHAFIPILHSGHIGIFCRVKNTGYSVHTKSKKSRRERIKELYTGRISDFYSNEPMLDVQVMEYIDEHLTKHLEHEIDFFIEKYSKKG